MPTRKYVQPGEKVPLKLTASERKSILDDLMCLDKDHEQVIRNTPSDKPVLMTLGALDDFGGYIAAEANHCKDKKKRNKLDAIFEKIQRLLDKYTDEEPPKTVNMEDASKAKVISDQAAEIAVWAAQALIAAEQLGIKKKPLDHRLAPAQRDFLLLVPGISKAIKNKLIKAAPVTVAEVASMTMAVAEDLTAGDARKLLATFLVAKHLMDQLHERIVSPVTPKASKKSKANVKAAKGTLFQFKITLVGSKPAIWRRIQVQDCALGNFHDILQVVMGWENCHMHQFMIDGERYGTPLPDDFDLDFKDEDKLRLSQIVRKSGKKVRFRYEYDFGDGWLHDIAFENFVQPEANAKYPRCVDGARSGPHEDVGGVWGYEEFLQALADPKHERHDEMMEWGEGWDAEKFSVQEINKELRGFSRR